jgi:hypothetical protein
VHPLSPRTVRAHHLGAIVAEALAGGWRDAPPRLALATGDLEFVAPFLLETGAGAIAWRRMRGTALATAPCAGALEHAYRVSALQTALHERAIVEAFALLRAAGVEPLLFKGWLAARLYPDPGLRPYGDIDLCVRSEDAGAAREALAPLEANVDLHVGLSPNREHSAALADEPLTRLFARSRLIPLNGAEIRVLAPEDHFALLCLHLAAHGAHPPLQLCDVAAAVELLADDFDWEVCLGESRRRAVWIAWAVQLAGRVLGARIDRVPGEVGARRMPGWLEPAVLHRWGTPASVWWPRGWQRTPFLSSAGSIRETRDTLRARWPSPIAAAVELTPPVWWLPRLPAQLTAFALDFSRFTRRALRGA